jgi:hypothetical protein
MRGKKDKSGKSWGYPIEKRRRAEQKTVKGLLDCNREKEENRKAGFLQSLSKAEIKYLLRWYLES